jgi:hypothetical protein
MNDLLSGTAGNNNNKFREQLLLISKARFCGLFFDLGFCMEMTRFVVPKCHNVPKALAL